MYAVHADILAMERFKL